MSRKLIQKKVCLLGNFAVGKTSLIRRFVEDQFDDAYLSTIGVKISKKTIILPNYDLNMLIWDLAGDNDFSKTSNMYLRGAVAALIVIDLTRLDTVDSFRFYADQLNKINPNAAIVLIGNKIDLEKKRVVSEETLINISHELGYTYFCTSAKTGFQVDEAFKQLAMSIEV